jgi:hypothetical protein
MTSTELAILRADIARLTEAMERLARAIERMQPPKREPGGDEVRG